MMNDSTPIPESFPVIAVLIIGTYLIYIVWYWLTIHSKRIKSIEKSLTDLKTFAEYVEKNSDEVSIKTNIDKFFNENREEKSDVYKSLNLAWKEFSEGAFEFNGVWRNVYQAEEFFTKEFITQPIISPIKHVPALSSGIGLLFTFLALAIGLSQLHYDETSKIIDKGLGEFINALAAKFVTSILGLLLAMWIDSKQVRNFEKELDAHLLRIIFDLNVNFKRLTTQHLLINLNKDVHEIPQKISEFFDSNSSSNEVLSNLEKSISEGVKSAVSDIQAEISKVSGAMENFSAAGVNGMATQLESIGKEMREGLTQGLSQDLNSLKSTMEKLPEIISETLKGMEASNAQMKIQISDSQKEMSKLIKEIFEEIQSKQGDSLNQLLENLINKNNEITQKLSDQQELMQRKHEESMDIISRKLFENNESSSSQLTSILEQMKQTFEESSRQFKDSLFSQQNQMQELTEKLLQNLGQQTSGLTENLEKSTRSLHEDYSRFQQESKELQDGHLSGIKTNYESSVQQMIESQEQFKSNIESILNQNKLLFEPMLEELRKNIQALSKQTLALPEELRRSSTELNIAFEKIQGLLNREMTDFIRQQSSMNESQRKSLTELSDYLNKITQLQNESKNLHQLMDKLVAMQEKLINTSDQKDANFASQLELLRVAMEQQRSLLDTHQAAANKLHDEYKDINNLVSNVATEFGGVGDSLAKSLVQIKDASHGYFDGFSEYHSQAISQLKGLIEDMSSAINDSQFTVNK